MTAPAGTRTAHLATRGAVISGLALALCLPASAAAQPPPGPARAAVTASLANPIPGELFGVVVRSSSNAWAVGTTGGSSEESLIVHWNGTAWSQVRSPDPSKDTDILFAVSADARTDAWAAGYSCGRGCGRNNSLVAHWNGTAWSNANAPNPGRTDVLNGVKALSPSDVWAVGTYCVSSCQLAPILHTLILHWDGTAWSQVPSPNPGATVNTLTSVSADSATDVWAVGRYVDPAQAAATLILHWDGKTWSQVPSPNPAQNPDLRSVSALSSTEVWTVGRYCSANCDFGATIYNTLAMHWDGTAWSIVPTPNPAAHLRELDGVSARSATDVWAVGGYNGSSATKTLIEHWNGTGWSIVSSPNPSATSNVLSGVAALTSTDAWAVGDYVAFGGTAESLMLHWNGTAWSVK